MNGFHSQSRPVKVVSAQVSKVEGGKHTSGKRKIKRDGVESVKVLQDGEELVEIRQTLLHGLVLGQLLVFLELLEEIALSLEDDVFAYSSKLALQVLRDQRASPILSAMAGSSPLSSTISFRTSSQGILSSLSTADEMGRSSGSGTPQTWKTPSRILRVLSLIVYVPRHPRLSKTSLIMRICRG
jgi:hypothetical protein